MLNALNDAESIDIIKGGSISSPSGCQNRPHKLFILFTTSVARYNGAGVMNNFI